MKTLLSIFLICLSLPLLAQHSKDSLIESKVSYPHGTQSADTTPVFEYVDKFPAFPGGMDAYTEYLQEHINYPDLARELGIQGTVFLSMIVATDGKIEEVKILKDIGAGCGAEAKRVVENMPNWSPGEMGGKPVKVKTAIRIKFTLSEPQITLPQFIGGTAAYEQYLNEHLDIPRKVKRKFINDNVIVHFTVLKSGEITKITLFKGIDNCKKCNENALEFIRNMPKWNPSAIDGEPLDTQTALRIPFSYK